MAPFSPADLTLAVTGTIAARHFTYRCTTFQPLPDGSEMSSRDAGYVDIADRHIDSHTETDFGDTSDPDDFVDEGESCPTTVPIHMMLDDATIFMQFPDGGWDAMPFPGLGASSVAPLFWLFGATETKRVSEIEIEVVVDFERACALVPEWLHVSVREGLAHFFADGADRTAGGVVQIADGLIQSISLNLPARLDLSTGERIPESAMTLSLAPADSRILTFPETM